MLSLEEVLAELPAKLQKVFEDSRVTELMINSPESVWYERDGCLYPVYTEGLTSRDLEATAMKIARPLGLDANKTAPIVDARLPDGSRVAIACPPIAETYALSIRRFGSRPWTADKLVEAGSLPREVLRLAERAFQRRENILVSGGTGTGKTTLLGALASLINEEERIVAIEDTRELQIPAPNCLRLEARGANVTIRSLVRHALRHRPDRLIVGEVRGEEAQDLIEALNTGHGGSISTVHANSARAALTRLATCALQSATSPPWAVVCELVALAVQYVIHLERTLDGRRAVRQVLRVDGFDRIKQDFQCSIVWREAESNGNYTSNHIEQAEHPEGDAAAVQHCGRCSSLLSDNGKDRSNGLCGKCHRREQNRRAYEKRKAKG